MINDLLNDNSQVFHTLNGHLGRPEGVGKNYLSEGRTDAQILINL